jgi:RNA polymerase sigma factor (sigma-70 family)
VDPEQQYLAQRSFIDRTVAAICQRHHVSSADRDDVVSAAHFHMVRDDYRVFRVFEGRAPIEVYLLAVIRQVFQDWRNAAWGRWRPSVAARRLGPVAVLIETLSIRDGLPWSEVVEIVRTNHGVADTPAALEAIAAQLPERPRRTFVDEAAIDTHRSAPSAEQGHMDAVEAARVSAAVDQALMTLPTQDRLLLRLRFDDDLAIGALAQYQGVDYQTAYRHLGRVLQGLRRLVEASGVSASDAADVLARRGLAMRDERTP